MSKLPGEYSWRCELDQHTLYFLGMPVATVEPLVHGMMVRILIRDARLGPKETIVRSIDHGKAVTERWAAERTALIRKACGRANAQGAEHAADASEAPSVARWFQN